MLPQSTARSYLHDVQYPLGVLPERPRRSAFYCGIVGSRQRTLHLTPSSHVTPQMELVPMSIPMRFITRSDSL